MSAEIYLAGDVGSIDLEELEEEYPDQTFLKGDPDEEGSPAELVDAAHEMMEQADGILVVHDGEENYVTDVLIRTAYEHGTPAVVYNDADEAVSPWLAYHTRYVDDRLHQATPCLLMYAGVSAEDVISKG